MRPIVSFCGSPTYQLSKYLMTILQPITDKSRRKLQSTEDFISATKTIQIPDDYKLVSFDVKSLFTSIPLQLAQQCTETAILQSTDPLPTEDFNIRLSPHNVSYWLTSKTKTKTNRGTVREQCIRSIATSVTLAETSKLDWLNTNKRWGKAMSTITLLTITDFRTTLLTGTLRNA